MTPPGQFPNDPDIDAEGRRVSFLSGGRVWIARPDGSGLTELPPANVTSQTISADGTMFGLSFNLDLIQIYDLRSETLTTVPGYNNSANMVRIGSGGTRVVFSDATAVWMSDADASNVNHVGDGYGSYPWGGPDLSADGERVVFEDLDCLGGQNCQNRYYTFIANGDGTGLTRLTSLPDTDYVGSRVSDDGSTVLFQFSRAGSFDWDLGAVDGNGSNERALTSYLPVHPIQKPGCSYGCDSGDLSGDGSAAAFSTRRPGFKPGIVYVVRTDGSGIRQIGYGGPAVAINRDGSIVAYNVVDEDYTNPRLHVTALPGFAPKELDDLRFAADGQTLTWASSPLANSHNLYRAELGDSGGALTLACLEDSITSASASDSDFPLAGHVFAYAVTGANGTAEGTAGSTSGLVERIPSAPCPAVDSDGDAVPDVQDNCPLVPNPSQANADGDSMGDICDSCPTGADESVMDRDLDGVGDACEAGEDPDADGVPNGFDNCPTISNPSQADSDGNGLGNACDNDHRDLDNDGIADSFDNCPVDANAGQADVDGDGMGDACDPEDYDGDGIANFLDNCATRFNPGQADTDGDGIGDACESE